MTAHVLPQADFPIERLSVVILTEGPRRDELSLDERQRLANEHLQYQVGLAQAGHIVHAGALIDDGPPPRVTGLGISRLSHDALAPLMREDPGVIAGMLDFRLVTHAFREGALAFPHAVAPSRGATGESASAR